MRHLQIRQTSPLARRLAAPLLLLSAALVGCGGVDDGTARLQQPEPVQESTRSLLALDLQTRYQTLEGFGAAVAWYGGFLAYHPNAAELYQLLFPELGANILRLRNTFGRDEGPEFGTDIQMIVEGATQALGQPPTIQMSSWSPPAAMKDNDAERCDNVCQFGQPDCKQALCTLKRNAEGQFVYDQFADYWHESLLAYQALGIYPTWISIQNEPDFTPNGWEGCRFAPTEDAALAGYSEALGAVAARIAELPSAPKLIGPETLGVHRNRVLEYSEGMNLDLVYGVAHHLYEGEAWQQPDEYASWLTSIARRHTQHPVFQTEFGEGGFFETAWLVNNSLVHANAAVYLYWELIWAGKGLIALENPFEPETWQTPRGYSISPQYYALKHFSRHTAPGYVRVGADSGSTAVRASAYQSADGSALTVVLLNVGDGVRFLQYDFAQHGATTISGVRSTDDDFWKDMGSLGLTGELEIAPRTVLTLTLDLG